MRANEAEDEVMIDGSGNARGVEGMQMSVIRQRPLRMRGSLCQKSVSDGNVRRCDCTWVHLSGAKFSNDALEPSISTSYVQADH